MDKIRTLEAVEELLRRGYDNGYLTVGDVIAATSQLNREIDSLDPVLDVLEDEGIEIYEDHRETTSSYELAIQKEKQGNLDFLDADDAVGLYFRDVRPIPLLSREEEVELAKRIEKGEEARNRLTDVEDDLDFEERARLEAAVVQGRQALQKLVESNFRLVISIARKYARHDVPMLDLIQEGNLALITAAEKFDHRKGFKFSTYATWWIRQAIQRALADQGRTIRIPVHMVDRIRRLNRITDELQKELGRPPTVDEICQELDLSRRQVKLALNTPQHLVSLEKTVSDEEDDRLADLIEDEDVADPAEQVDDRLLSEEIEEMLCTLTPRETRILTMRYGLSGGREYTLREVGEVFGLTRERIRQIEQQALRKLRHPRRSLRLRSYLN